MRRAVLLPVLMLALAIAAFGNCSLASRYSGGRIQPKGATLPGSAQFTGFNGSGGTIKGNLEQYQTGSFTGRTVTGSADTYSFAAGGFFTIASNLSGLSTGTTLTGIMAGTVGNGVRRARARVETAQITFDMPGHVPLSSTVRGNNGSTTAPAVPEPGTLGLLGTGLVGIACLVRRKFRRLQLPSKSVR